MTDSLLSNQADVNAFDKNKNHVIKYSLLSLSNETLQKIPECHNFEENPKIINLFGGSHIFEKLLAAGVDLRVTDAEGNYPLHITCSFGDLKLFIGGYSISVRGSAYRSSVDDNSPNNILIKLIEAGASVNDCNSKGIIPLHIAAGFGDIESIKSLILSGSNINILDNFGFLPIHYAVACAHETSLKATLYLLETGIGKALVTAVFKDERSGKDNLQKFHLDLQSNLADIFSEALSPNVINLKRMNRIEILTFKTNENINILQLALSTHHLNYENLDLFIIKNDFSVRNEIVEFLLNNISPNNIEFYQNQDCLGTSLLHSLTLFYLGDIPSKDLKPNHRLNPVRYANSQVQLLEYIFRNDHDMPSYINCKSNRALLFRLSDTYSDLSEELGWYPLIGAILSKNNFLITYLINKGADPEKSDAFNFTTKYYHNELAVGINGLLALRLSNKE